MIPHEAIHSTGAGADITARVAVVLADGRRHTARQLASVVGCSVTTAHRALHALREAGFVEFDAGKQGTIRTYVRRVG